MDVLLRQAMCGHNTNGSVGLHKHTHKLKQQFSLADQRVVKTLLRFTFAAFLCFLPYYNLIWTSIALVNSWKTILFLTTKEIFK